LLADVFQVVFLKNIEKQKRKRNCVKQVRGHVYKVKGGKRMEHQTNEIQSLMEQGHMLLGYKNWSDADKSFGQVLELSADYAPAYIGKLCVQLKVQHEENLADYGKPLEDIEYFQNALKFAEGMYREKVLYYNRSIHEAIGEANEAIIEANETERLTRNRAIKERNSRFDAWMSADKGLQMSKLPSRAEQFELRKDRNGNPVSYFSSRKKIISLCRWQLDCKCGNLYDDGAEFCPACGLSTAEEDNE